MAFKGIIFAGQNVTPKDDGALYNAHYGDGILNGCEMAISGDDLVVQSGHFIAGGRVCHVDGATSVDLSSRTLTNGYIQVVMDFDISKPEGMQWNIHLPLIESATTTFPALTKDDINGTGTLYQFALAVVQISGGILTNITSQMLPSDLTSLGNVYLNGSDDTRSANVRLYYNNALVGRVYSNSSRTRITQTDGSLSDQCGIDMIDPDIITYGNGGTISLRPNGRTNSSGQTQINPNGTVVVGGQITKGHPLVCDKSLSSAKSVSAGTVTNLLSQTGLDASGIYLVTAFAGFTPSGANTNVHMVLANSATAQNVLRDDKYCPTATNYYWTITGIVTGETAIYFNIYSVLAGTTIANQPKLQIIRIH